jgi:hypothetical protein
MLETPSSEKSKLLKPDPFWASVRVWRPTRYSSRDTCGHALVLCGSDSRGRETWLSTDVKPPAMAIPQVRTPLRSNFSLLRCPSQPPGSRRRESLAHVPSPPLVPPHHPTRPRPLTSATADRGPATVREATEAIAAPPPPTSPLHSSPSFVTATASQSDDHPLGPTQGEFLKHTLPLSLSLSLSLSLICVVVV